MKIIIDGDMYANEMVHIELTDEEIDIIAAIVKDPKDKIFYPAFGMPVIELLENIDTASAFKMEEELAIIEADIMNFYLDAESKVSARDQFRLKAENEIAIKILAEVIRKSL